MTSTELPRDFDDIVRDAVQDRMGAMIHEEVGREEERRYRQLRWLVAFVGVVGLGTFGTLSNYLIEKAVESKLEARTGNISESLDFARFYTLTLKLELGTEFSPDDRDAIMSYLRKAAGKGDIRQSPEFRAGLFQVTRAFAAANQAPSLDEIFSLFQREVLASPPLVESLLHHYGQDIVGRTTAPTDDASLKTFESLERVSAASKVPELALYYRLLLDFKRLPEASGQVREIIGRVIDLNETDLARFVFELLTHSRAENWQNPPAPDGREIERMTRQLLREANGELTNRLLIDRGILELAQAGQVDKTLARRAGEQAAAKVRTTAGGA